MEIRNRVWLGLGIVVAVSTAFYAGTSNQSRVDHSMSSAAEASDGGEDVTTASAISDEPSI